MQESITEQWDRKSLARQSEKLQKDTSRTLFQQLLRQEIADGKLVLVDAYLGHNSQSFSSPSAIVVTVNRPEFYQMTLARGSLGLGEAYMMGFFDVKDYDLPSFTTLLLKANLDQKVKSTPRFMLNYARVLFDNYFRKDHVNVRAHYDIGDDLFEHFLLDEFMVYSCGYAHSWDDDIDTLQRNKLDRICRKLELKEGDRLLDIGCGNGGLLIYAARHFGVTGVGYSNSVSHSEKARERVTKYALQDRITIKTGDFESINGQFDKVVSVGMLEHVRPGRYKKYFAKIAQVLTDDGKALVHAISANSSDKSHDPFIQKYIFPGSSTPSLSDYSRNIERNDMAILDVENIVRHYAVTTRRWLEAFDQNTHRLSADRYDDTFKRMWRFYLSIGISAALASQLGVFQVLFNKDYSAEHKFQRV
ncbi:MAG: class I SAM-dependent methyltransferase [Gammaproteobacteria bacterium]|jgi:cyclopropane-fatty-acyl-phospholipid synthase